MRNFTRYPDGSNQAQKQPAGFNPQKRQRLVLDQAAPRRCYSSREAMLLLDAGYRGFSAISSPHSTPEAELHPAEKRESCRNRDPHGDGRDTCALEQVHDRQ